MEDMKNDPSVFLTIKPIDLEEFVKEMMDKGSYPYLKAFEKQPSRWPKHLMRIWVLVVSGAAIWAYSHYFDPSVWWERGACYVLGILMCVYGPVAIFDLEEKVCGWWKLPGLFSGPTVEKMVSSLPDSFERFGKDPETTRRFKAIVHHVETFNAQLAAFIKTEKILQLKTPAELEATANALIQERAEIISKVDAILTEWEEMARLDSERVKCIRRFDELLELEEALSANHQGKYRETTDITTLVTAQTLRQELEDDCIRLRLPVSLIPSRNKKLPPVG